LTTTEFHEETCKRRAAELEKEPTEIDLNKLIEMDESQTLEFKSSVWASYRNDTGDLVTDANKNYKTEDSIIKTIAGFLNTEGGKLVIGVQERPKFRVVGIESDFPYSGGEKSLESFQNGLQGLVRNSTHSETIVGTYVFIRVEPIQGKKVCVIDVKQRQPEKWTWVDMKTIDGGKPAKEVFYVRSGPQTKLISSQESGHEWRSSNPDRRDKWEHWD
jgi:type I restriction enzyme R subunit